jgi:CubicO group peptidase (beta-lactamase class C family)
MITEQARKQAKELAISVERLEYLDRFLAKAVGNGVHPSVAIRVSRRGVEIFNGAYGVAAPGGPPLQLDMITDVASVTKPVTATMVMMLQEDGLLELWDSVQQYFPEFTGEHKDEVKLWHLLTHSSGLDDDALHTYRNEFLKKLLGDAMPSDPVPDGEWEEAINGVRRKLGQSQENIEKEPAFAYADRMALGVPLKQRPHTLFCYCSTGYNMLAQVCEKLTGEKFDALVQRRIFGPLGMTDSHFVLPKEKWPRVLLREASCRGGEWRNSDRNKVTFGGSSGLKTTVGDLLRFGLMFRGNGTLDGVRILSPASVRAMTTDYNKELPPSFWRRRWYDSNWGLGWNIRCGKFDDLGVLRSDSSYDHAGHGGARLFVDPEHELVYASYMVDQNNDDYGSQGKVTNILYSALD